MLEYRWVDLFQSIRGGAKVAIYTRVSSVTERLIHNGVNAKTREK